MRIFDTSMTIMERAMDVRMVNQRVTTSNIANVDTPGFVARKVNFELSMDNALRGKDSPAVVEKSRSPQLSLDGNNVDIDQEMSELSRNKLMYNVTSQILGAKFRQLSTVFDKEK